LDAGLFVTTKAGGFDTNFVGSDRKQRKNEGTAAALYISRLRPVSVLVATTFAATITAPVGSKTVPARVQVGSAAFRDATSRRQAIRIRFILFSFRVRATGGQDLEIKVTQN
jgi:hypothetical protein